MHGLHYTRCKNQGQLCEADVSPARQGNNDEDKTSIIGEPKNAFFFQIRQNLVKPLKTAFSREVVDSSGKIKLLT